MATIAWLNIGLSVSTDTLKKGLKKGRKLVSDWAESGWNGLKWGGVAAAGAAGGLLLLARNSAEAIDATAKLADRLGTTTEALVGLQHNANLAGSSGEELAKGLEKLGVNLAKAAAGGGAAADSIAGLDGSAAAEGLAGISAGAGTAVRSLGALGLSADSLAGLELGGDLDDDLAGITAGAGPAGAALAALGLSAANLAGMDRIAATGEIADALNRIQNPAQKAAYAVALFGKAGQNLLPMLSAGSEGIRQAQEEAEKLGLTFRRVDAAKVEAANDAMSRIGTVITSVGQSLAIGLAPYIEAAATKFTELRTAGLDFGEITSKGLEFVEGAIGFVADTAQRLKGIFMEVRASVTDFIGASLTGIGQLGEAIAGFINRLTGSNLELGEGLQDMGEAVRIRAAEEWAKSQVEKSKAPPSRRVGDFFASLRGEADAAAQAAVGAGQSIAAIGPDVAAQLKEAQKEQEEWAKKAESFKDSIKTPLEEYQAKVKEIRELAARGLIDPEEMTRGLKLAETDLAKAGGSDRTAGAAMELGSQEARRTLLAWNARGEGSGDTGRDTLRATQKVRDEAVKQTPILAKIQQGIATLAATAAAAIVEI